MIHVKLITHTPYPDDIVYLAAKTCYSKEVDYNSSIEIPMEEKIKLIKKVIASGHLSVLEHVNFTFAITGVSRVFLAQITRHRIASYSVRSMRYVNLEDTDPYRDMIYPLNCHEIPEFVESYKDSLKTYSDLIKKGINKEDARYVLPNGSPSPMMVTMNARELLHYFALRCCNRTQKEHQFVAVTMLGIVKHTCHLFDNAGASCTQLGYCPEGDKSCGAYPTLDELKEAYNERKFNNG